MASHAPSSRSSERNVTAKRRIGIVLLVTLGVLSMVSPLATDLYLPALPRISDEFGATATHAQLSLTGFMAGMMLGQLFFGPLADRFGRRGPLLIGTVLFVLASAATVVAPSVEVLIAARLVQGFSGAAATVIARAIVTDLARGQEAARAMNLLLVILGAAPIIAPLLGGLFAESLGWRGLLGIVLALGVVMLVLALLVVRETYPRAMREQARAAKQAGSVPLRTLASRQYIGYTIAFAFAFGMMMSYISGSPFVFQRMAGLSEFQYSLVLGSGALTLVIGTAVAARLSTRFPVAGMLAVGNLTMLAAAVVLVVFVFAGVAPLVFAAPMVLMAGGMSLVLGNAAVLALDVVPPAASGTASALLGAMQYAVAAAVTPLVSLAGEMSAIPLAIVMLTCGVIATSGWLLARSGVSRAAERATSQPWKPMEQAAQ